MFGHILSSEASLFLFLYVFCWCYSVTPISSGLSIHKPSSATKLAKKKETPGSVSAARGFFVCQVIIEAVAAWCS